MLALWHKPSQSGIYQIPLGYQARPSPLLSHVGNQGKVRMVHDAGLFMATTADGALPFWVQKQ